MEFAFSPNQLAFRDEVRTYLDQEWAPHDVPVQAVGTLADRYWTQIEAFRKKIADKGWVGVGWPQEYGGLGLGIMEQLLFHEEMVYYQAPIDHLAYIFGGTLIKFGSDSLKRQILGPMARAEIQMCQGFSEPDAGSDLASLQTVAVADGDQFLVSGSKIWTSYAHHADYCALLARTDVDAPKHKGITYMVLDMRHPGITISPLMDALGEHHFNQVFFDRVPVPKDWVVGEVNRGWYVAMGNQNEERGTNMLHMALARRMLDDIAGYVRENGTQVTQVHRSLLAEAACLVQAARWLAYRVGWQVQAGEDATMASSQSKMFATEAQQRICGYAMRVLGIRGQLWHHPLAPVQGSTIDSIIGSIPNTIAAGSNEIQRNIIAQRGLGLPR